LATVSLLGIRVNDQTLPLRHSPNFIGVRQHALARRSMSSSSVRARLVLLDEGTWGAEFHPVDDQVQVDAVLGPGVGA
jgi:hypothetical protein